MHSAGEATMRLLSRYGVDTVFGIPGVHTLDFCRGLGTGSGLTHIHTRHEQGAAMMADGYARATGRLGVALVISGPGVTNAATALGQAHADSVPLLLLSAEARTESLGRGWGVLHEVTDLGAVTRPLTGLTATARSPEDIPRLMAEAFSVLTSGRPRPVHIAIPTDVLAMQVTGHWEAVAPPPRPLADPASIVRAAELLGAARRPVMVVGAGGAGTGDLATRLAERLGAPVLSSLAGKGVVPDGHPLCLGGAFCRDEGRAVLAAADAVLAIGTELSETDTYAERLSLGGPLVRIDIDPRQMHGLYPASVPVVGDAGPAMAALLAALGPEAPARDGAAEVADALAAINAGLDGSEPRHVRMLARLRAVLRDDAVIFGDSCQPVYTGAFAMPVYGARQWHPAGGYCTLGGALPGAIGAKVALPDRAVLAIAGDGGLMFTVQDLLTAAEQRLALPVIVWENAGFKQIRDDMLASNVPRIGVDGIGPDWPALAQALRTGYVEPDSGAAFDAAIRDALAADGPTLVLVREAADWLA